MTLKQQCNASLKNEITSDNQVRRIFTENKSIALGKIYLFTGHLDGE